jgi:hypothetical protein
MEKSGPCIDELVIHIEFLNYCNGTTFTLHIVMRAVLFQVFSHERLYYQVKEKMTRIRFVVIGL